MISYEDSLEMHEAVIGYISRWLNQNPSSTLARLAIEARVPEDELYDYYEHGTRFSHSEIKNLVDYMLSPRERDIFDQKYLLGKAV